MKVKILRTEDGELIDGEISEAKNKSINLPSISDHWRFNFKKHSQNKNTKTYILTLDHEEIIEGCLIFEMRDKVEPYMAYIEVAPHNKGKWKKLDRVAGCLIAFASRLSFIYGKKDYTGWLTFDVKEETGEERDKLMAVYSEKYKAVRINDTTIMFISPENGEWLINEYLNVR
ncbi:MAG: hypothetical protein LBE92_08180 [Chryseobacterium sp.]|jgi:hypothetical protein|uniref:hypothetical protein n=1 Tax=Chryseobacterium sp. TaxID=1871047 RepID=UPI0028238186|nr:hypothetical protein [Chryseobacterium sp.]MDR2236086.1 hypothetical protein [Chryseobacterium sp.]